jgi:CRISPR-associated protein Cas1
MLSGRLGLEGARVAQGDRHGLLWLGRGNLYVKDGTLRFATVGTEDMPAGNYAIPYQTVTSILMQPGTTISHDALRILARHGTGVVAVGDGGVRFYASMPFGPNESARARRQAAAWADPERRIDVARRMYAWRLGELLPVTDINALRGIEGARMKKSYQHLAQSYGIAWHGRRYDRADPESADVPNQAINHAASAVEAAAMIAVAVTGTIPQLGFIHEDAGIALPLDIADLFRDTALLPIAFGAAKEHGKDPKRPLEGCVRQLAGKTIVKERIVPKMIDRIKELFDDGSSDAERA